MIPKPLQSIVEADLLDLIGSKAEEGVQLDFKRELPKDDHDGRKAFFSDICAFANTSGGDLIYGMNEVEGVATNLIPQTLPTSPDGYVLKITSSIRDRIEPALHGVHIHPVALSNGGYALVIRVQRSFSGIHRYKADGQFYIRRSRSNEPLDVPGIVNRVADQLGREDRVTSFFSRRYTNILANEHSLQLSAGPKLVVHIVPARDFLSGEQVDLESISMNENMPFLNDSGNHSERRTFDGRAFFDAHESNADYFTMFMQSGVVEACRDLIPSYWPDEHKKIDLGYVEESVLKFLSAFQTGDFARISTGLPFIVRVALLGTNDLPYTSGARVDLSRHAYGVPVRQPLAVLTLPEILVEGDGVDLAHEMHGTFLRMWHAWGYSKSYHYVMKEGKWQRNR